MKCFVLCNVGFEHVVSKELSFFGCENFKFDKGFVLFDIVSFEKLFELYYSGRSFTKLVLLLDDFSFSSFDELLSKISSVDVKDWVVDGFGVDCLRLGDHGFTSFDVKQSVVKCFSEKYSLSVDFKSSFQFFSLIKDSSCFFGVDFCSVDLGKRDYRIFLKGQNLKGNEAFCLLYYIGIDKDLVLLDPFCRSGVILVEASLYLSNKSHNFFSKDKFSFVSHPKFKDVDFDSFFESFDKNIVKFSAKIFAVDCVFPNVQAAKKNAKIAGVFDLIDFSRKDVGDLDLKFDKNVDLIVTFPERVVDDLFFKQCSLILNSKGKLVIVSKNLLNPKNLSLVEKFSFFQGKDELFVHVFQKTATQHL